MIYTCIHVREFFSFFKKNFFGKWTFAPHDSWLDYTPTPPRKARNSLIVSTLRNLLRSLLITKVNKKPIIFAP